MCVLRICRRGWVALRNALEKWAPHRLRVQKRGGSDAFLPLCLCTLRFGGYHFVLLVRESLPLMLKSHEHVTSEVRMHGGNPQLLRLQLSRWWGLSELESLILNTLRYTRCKSSHGETWWSRVRSAEPLFPWLFHGFSHGFSMGFSHWFSQVFPSGLVPSIPEMGGWSSWRGQRGRQGAANRLSNHVMLQ